MDIISSLYTFDELPILVQIQDFLQQNEKRPIIMTTIYTKRPLGVEIEIGFLCLRHVTCMYIMNIDVTTWSFSFHNVKIRNDHDELNFEISRPRD